MAKRVSVRVIFAAGECDAGAKNGRKLTVGARASSKSRLMDYLGLNQIASGETVQEAVTQLLHASPHIQIVAVHCLPLEGAWEGARGHAGLRFTYRADAGGITLPETADISRREKAMPSPP